jgi:hypothetical protein
LRERGSASTQRLRRKRVLVAQYVGHRLAGDLAGVHVQAIESS